MAFHGQVALITGGGSGMGQREAERLAARGHRVAALDLNEEGLAKTGAANDRITTYRCDVTDTDEVNKVVESVEAELGQIDRVVAAAGIMPSDLALDMDTQVMHKVMDVNYGGVVNVVKATLPDMVERGRGDMIVFASLVGIMPMMHFSAYCASKAAVKSFTEIIYHENVSTGVRFACVCPPMVETPLLAQATSNPKAFGEGKSMTPDEVLDATEAHLEKGRFMVTPGQARYGAAAARLIPNQIWKNMHKIEGR